MQLNDALHQIALIRRQMARGEVFRGYRAATAMVTAGIAVAGAVVQSFLLSDSIAASLSLWVGAAVLSLLIVGIEMRLRAPRFASSLHQELAASAVELLIPCLVAGSLLTVVIVWFAAEAFWMLPALWSILFGLGIFASRRLLPRGASAVGGWYLMAGLVCIAVASRAHVFLPWQMGVIFGVGQLLAAGVLYWNLEREHARQN